MNENLFQMESRIKPSEQFVALSNEVLQELVHTTSGIEGVLLSSTDGFGVNSIFKKLMTVASFQPWVARFWRWYKL